jgi:hypothetical protein
MGENGLWSEPRPRPRWPCLRQISADRGHAAQAVEIAPSNGHHLTYAESKAEDGGGAALLPGEGDYPGDRAERFDRFAKPCLDVGRCCGRHGSNDSDYNSILAGRARGGSAIWDDGTRPRSLASRQHRRSPGRNHAAATTVERGHHGACPRSRAGRRERSGQTQRPRARWRSHGRGHGGPFRLNFDPRAEPRSGTTNDAHEAPSAVPGFAGIPRICTIGLPQCLPDPQIPAQC